MIAGRGAGFGAPDRATVLLPPAHDVSSNNAPHEVSTVRIMAVIALSRILPKMLRLIVTSAVGLRRVIRNHY
jgi:hypothetical protein